ncbi:Dioxygenase [Colletotrichum sp. SAR 10_65]|nr:Dioxygenase [Colletotrichum sp. SAR 10_65]KAI8179861.1 Dioxygenase [Colletotrichum sp. SAR 10_75]
MHGGGASPDIFRFQTSSLRAALAHEYDFLYASAPHLATPGPDVLPFFAGMDPFYSWFRPVHDDPASEIVTFNEAVHKSVETYTRSNPGVKIVGVLGFSQGAVASTMLLWQRQVGRVTWLPDVKFGILLCPGYSAVATEYMRDICERENRGEEGIVVQLPTLHLHGRQDTVNLPQSRRMYATHYRGAKLTEFDGEHEVPRKVGDVKKVIDLLTTAKMSFNLPPPASPSTSGLDFADKPYHTSRIDPLTRFHEDVAQVRRWVEDNLSNFSHLNEIIVLRLGSDTLPHQHLTIDATTVPPVLATTIPSTLHKSITILPEYILDAIEGRMHSQHAFGKRATPPTHGAIPSCFAPAGVPAPCMAVDSKALPKPTEDVAQLKRDLTTWGYAVCANALSAEQVQIIRTAVEEQAEAERLVGVGHLDTAHKKAGDQPNQRVWNLPNKGDEFLDLLNHPLIDAVMPWFLGGNFSLFTMSANIARPGTSGIYMHRDQMVMTPDTTAHAYVLNSMCRTWHSTGVNTTNEARPVILQSFCRFFIRQIESYQAILSDNVKAKLSERQRALLGLPSLKPGGKGQGFAVYDWPGTQVGRMRVTVGKQ